MSVVVSLVAVNKFFEAVPPVFEETLIVVEHSLEAAGFECRRLVNAIDPNGINIIWGVGGVYSFPLEEISKCCPASCCIIFNMENLLSDSELVTTEYIDFLGKYFVFDYNQANVDFLNSQDQKCRSFEFPIVPTIQLSDQYQKLNFNLKPNFDVGFFGSINDRRKLLLQSVAATGLSIKIINAYGLELAQELLDCKLVINIHYYKPGLLEVARCLIPFALGIPVVSEVSILTNSVDWTKSGIVFAHDRSLPRICSEILKSSEKLSHLSVLAEKFRLNDEVISDIANKMSIVIRALSVLNESSGTPKSEVAREN